MNKLEECQNGEIELESNLKLQWAPLRGWVEKESFLKLVIEQKSWINVGD